MQKKLFKPKTMAALSILLAMEVIIARFGTIRPSESMKLSLDFVPVAAAAIMYGTAPAIVMSILADILGAFLFPVGPFFPGFTVTAALTGLIYGLFLHKKQTFPRIFCAVILQQLICSLLINTFWLKLLYGLPYLPTLVARLVQCGIMAAIQLVLIPLLAAAIRPYLKRGIQMTVKDAIDYIETCTWSATRLGLERTQELLHGLGDPQKRLKFVHVAGSNGKGSTCAMLSSILQSAGYRTGLYISPHIEDFSERIQVNGEKISGVDLAAITERVRRIADQMEDHPSQFELITAIAMVYFLEKKCDLVVLEVGMGGALDSTNAIDAPEVAVITNIGLEHTEYLGSTLEEIAETKGGIIKPGCTCVVYPSDPKVVQTISAICRQRAVQMTEARTEDIVPSENSVEGQVFAFRDLSDLRISLLGEHQLKNAAVVLTTVEALRNRGWAISDQAIRSGLKNTVWPARMEILHRDPLFMLDGGHNPQCAQALVRGLEQYLPRQRVTFLIGVLGDKDYAEILNIIRPYGASYVCLTPDNPRALPASELADLIQKNGQTAVAAQNAEQGILTALKAGDPVVAFGSLYLAGEIRKAFPKAVKHYQRRLALNRRNALSVEDRKLGSEAICSAIIGSDAYRAADTILVFNSFGSEADLSDVMKKAQADGKQVCWPCCITKNEMSAYAPLNDNAWKTGSYGIREPDPDYSALIRPQQIGLVICPCAGFDRFGNRVGMGGGYYDRYLPKCERAVVMIAAFEAQRLESVFTERTDWTADCIATERGIFQAEEKLT